MNQTEEILYSEFEKQVQSYISENIEDIKKPLLGGIVLMSFIANLKDRWLAAPDSVLSELKTNRVEYEVIIDSIVQRIMDNYMKFG